MQPQFRPSGPERPGFPPPSGPPMTNRPRMSYIPPGGAGIPPTGPPGQFRMPPSGPPTSHFGAMPPGPPSQFGGPPSGPFGTQSSSPSSNQFEKLHSGLPSNQGATSASNFASQSPMIGLSTQKMAGLSLSNQSSNDQVSPSNSNMEQNIVSNGLSGNMSSNMSGPPHSFPTTTTHMDAYHENSTGNSALSAQQSPVEEPGLSKSSEPSSTAENTMTNNGMQNINSNSQAIGNADSTLLASFKNGSNAQPPVPVSRNVMPSSNAGGDSFYPQTSISPRPPANSQSSDPARSPYPGNFSQPQMNATQNWAASSMSQRPDGMPTPGMGTRMGPPGSNIGSSPGNIGSNMYSPSNMGSAMHPSAPMGTMPGNIGSGMRPMSPGMPPPVGNQRPLGPGMPPSAGNQRPFGPGMAPSGGNMRPPNTGMPPSGGGMRPFSPGMAPPGGSMRPISPGMPPAGGSMRPLSPGMPLPGGGMRPLSPGMPPSTGSMGPGMRPSAPPGQYSSGMQPGSLPPQGSVPPQGGMQNRYPGSGTMSAGGMGGYSQSQGRKLNPDDMPSPLQVMEDDQVARSGEFVTNMKGDVPPLVTTKIVVRDGGNASPRFLRSTMYSVPATPDMMKKCAVPFGVVVSPYTDVMPDESPLYLGTSLTNGPVRCNRCKAYMSPLMMFMDGGRRFQCLLCKQVNEVPSDYYCHMDSQGARADKYQRPELCLGSFEYIATPEYCTNKELPKEPAFIFVIEMSQMMLQKGIVSLLCQNMKTILKDLPKDIVPGMDAPEFSKVHVGFVTYDSSVHFYKLSGLSPEMCIVCDKENMFVPVPDGILCDVEEVSKNIDKLMESIPQNFQSSKETSGNIYGAIHAGMAALKASGRSGKLFVFHSSLPQGEGLGKLKNREDRKVLGTEKEKTILAPQTNHYNNLAQDLVSAGCGVDMYMFNEGYMDFATIGQVSRLTGGQVHKYTHFNVARDGQRLLKNLQINVGRSIAFDAVMRVRTSTGVRPVEFFGHFFMSNTHDVELATIDSSKSIAVEIKHDDKITEEDGVYIQAALLYTSCGGQRRLRIINLSLNVCIQMADMYKSSDLDTIMNIWSKEAIYKLATTSSKQIKENLINKTAETLACYRKNCATPSSAGQLILPEQMKLLPLYVNCLSRSDALSGGSDMTCDDRSWHMYQLSTMNVAASLAYLYPRLLPLLDTDATVIQGTEIPPPLRTSYSKLRPDGVFLLENGLFMFIWVGSGTPSNWMTDVFGVNAPHQLDPVMSELPELDNENSERVRGIVEAVRAERGDHLKLFVVPQQGKHELVLRNYLVEDAGVAGSPGYVEFLCHVHKEIRSILS